MRMSYPQLKKEFVIEQLHELKFYKTKDLTYRQLKEKLAVEREKCDTK